MTTFWGRAAVRPNFLRNFEGAHRRARASVSKILNIKAPSNKVLDSSLLTRTPDGRWITFRRGAKTIKPKTSGSRTRITIGGKSVTRKALKIGMVLHIDYKRGKRNEPKAFD